MNDRGTGLLLVMIDVDPEHEDDLNRWYDEEHLPERLSCRGFLSARRFVAVEGEPKYLALYELETPEVLDTEDYQKLMRVPTEWTRRITTHFRRQVRNIYREIPT